jgi:protein kinase C substrate 80K-H
MACTEKDEIWKISESEKCIYQMEVGTAAVCGANSSGFKEKNSGKDELELTNNQPF